MDEALKLAMLFDLYGGLLTDKQREIFEFYHNDDLSLGEIAQNLGISRQGVRDALVHAEAALRETESSLKFLSEHERRSGLLRGLKENIMALRRAGFEKQNPELSAILKDLESKIDALRAL